MRLRVPIVYLYCSAGDSSKSYRRALCHVPVMQAWLACVRLMEKGTLGGRGDALQRLSRTISLCSWGGLAVLLLVTLPGAHHPLTVGRPDANEFLVRAVGLIFSWGDRTRRPGQRRGGGGGLGWGRDKWFKTI